MSSHSSVRFLCELTEIQGGETQLMEYIGNPGLTTLYVNHWFNQSLQELHINKSREGKQRLGVAHYIHSKEFLVRVNMSYIQVKRIITNLLLLLFVLSSGRRSKQCLEVRVGREEGEGKRETERGRERK